jgi:LPXTG-motif cell wall-anchored protein
MTANVTTSSSPSPSGPEFPNQVTVAAVAGISAAVVVGAGLLVYFKKRKRPQAKI